MIVLSSTGVMDVKVPKVVVLSTNIAAMTRKAESTTGIFTTVKNFSNHGSKIFPWIFGEKSPSAAKAETGIKMYIATIRTTYAKKIITSGTTKKKRTVAWMMLRTKSVP